MEDLARSKITDRKKRMEYLLKQSELFAHFGCSEAKTSKTTSKKSPSKTSPSRKKSKSQVPDTPNNSRRHRKTEEEEDAELLQTEKEEIKNYPTHV